MESSGLGSAVDWTGPYAWTRDALEAAGFEGWVSFEELADERKEPSSVGGVYVVIRAAGTAPGFLPSNPAGRFKGRDPSVSEPALTANWVDGAEVVYIGKADDLRRRLRQYRRFGEGEPVGHWGGRLIWQLEDSAMLVVAWAETPGRVPGVVEAEVLAAFREVWGRPPFANDPHRSGR